MRPTYELRLPAGRHVCDVMITRNARVKTEILPRLFVGAAANDLEPWMQEHFDLAGWLCYRKRSV